MNLFDNNIENYGWIEDGTSIQYKYDCELISQEEEVFKTFKRLYSILSIIQTVTEKQGKYYVDLLKYRSKANICKIIENDELMNKFKKNDMIGSPLPVVDYNHKNLKNINPTTLRYIKVYSDLKILFGEESLKDKDYYEIGGGFGGQSVIMFFANIVKSYTLIDLPETIKMSMRYLSSFREIQQHKLFFDTPYSISNKNIDFVISNYAFSELNKKMQDEYLEKVILKSQSGYITYNWHQEDNSYGAYSYKDIQQKISHLSNFSLREEKISGTKNPIFVWGPNLVNK